jgi:hypothetical protein
MTVAQSVAETGAKPGDQVRCIETSEPRYEPGKVYRVVDFCGRPSVLAVQYGRKRKHKGEPGTPAWNIPLRGYGATWERA